MRIREKEVGVMDKGSASARKKREFSKIFLILMTSALLVMLASAGILSIKPSIAVAQQGTPALKDKVGAHLIWLWRENQAKVDEVLDTMVAAGIKSLRMDFRWDYLEPVQGSWDWQAHEMVVNKATARGIDILGMLGGTPKWASSNPTAPDCDAYPCPPEHRVDWWGNYVNQVVTHFGGVGTWEVWNEPNLSFFKVVGSTSDNDDVEKVEYMNLVKVAYDEIAGRTKLAVGGFAGFGADGGSGTVHDTPRYLEACLKPDLGSGDLDPTKGAADYADIISFHPYPQNANTYNSSHPHEVGMQEPLQNMRNLINQYTPANKSLDLWITEIGWSNTAFANPYVVDEQTQADYSLRTFLTYLDDSGYTSPNLRINKIFYYNLWDQCHRESTSFKTADNGSTWARKSTRDNIAIDWVNGLNGVDTLDGTNLWEVGNHGQVSIMGSWNGGEGFVWQSGPASNLHSVSAASATTAYAVGENGTILKNVYGTGSLVSWSQQTSGIKDFLNGVSAADTSNVFAVGDNGRILNTRNGSSWSTQASGTTEDLNSVSAVSASIAWAVGKNGTVLTTSDRGDSWTPQTNGVPKIDLKSVSAVDQNVCWAVGTNGLILKTQDGGSTWSTQASNTTNGLNSIYALDASNAWAVGDNATILRTSDGTSWGTKPTHASMKRLTGVVAIDASTAVVIGYKDPWLENPDNLGTIPVFLNNHGLLDYLVKPTQTCYYLERLTVAGVAGDLFDNATAVAPDPLISNIVTNPSGTSATLQKHVFQMPDGSLLVSLWNSNADTSPQDPNATLGFTLTDASGSSTIYDNPVQVNLENGATGALDPSVTVGADASSNITVANLTIGKTPVILKYTKKPAPCGAGSGAAVMLLGLMMGLMSLAGGWRILRERAS